MIPVVMRGADAMGQARTGTGKTAAFAIPILERLKSQRGLRGPQALVLAPTRELAVQVRGEIEKLSFGRSTRCIAIYGGKPIRGQLEKLKLGPQIVVGTPGRVLDHIARRTLVLDDISIVVLDEADRMLDIGFRPDIEKILRRCPRDRQTLLLSATIEPPIQRLAQRYMRDPVKLDFSLKQVTVETIEQFYFTVDSGRKFDLLVRLLQREDPKQGIVFCRTKRRTDQIARRLSKRFRSIACMHGDMEQKARDRVMADFREERTCIMVATDVIGRGIDVTTISHIINFDIPQYSDDYVHRVGRAGRMGREGVAYTFVTPEEGGELTRIEIRINRQLQLDKITDFEPLEAEVTKDQPSEPPPDPPPASLRRGRGSRRHRRAL